MVIQSHYVERILENKKRFFEATGLKINMNYRQNI